MNDWDLNAARFFHGLFDDLELAIGQASSEDRSALSVFERISIEPLGRCGKQSLLKAFSVGDSSYDPREPPVLSDLRSPMNISLITDDLGDESAQDTLRFAIYRFFDLYAEVPEPSHISGLRFLAVTTALFDVYGKLCVDLGLVAGDHEGWEGWFNVDLHQPQIEADTTIDSDDPLTKLLPLAVALQRDREPQSNLVLKRGKLPTFALPIPFSDAARRFDLDLVEALNQPIDFSWRGLEGSLFPPELGEVRPAQTFVEDLATDSLRRVGPEGSDCRPGLRS